MNQTTADKALLEIWTDALVWGREHQADTIIIYNRIKKIINSLVSEPDEDNEPRHHISCVNCAIEWASQYESDNEIAKRMIEEYEAWNRPQPTAYSLAGLKKWLDKKPYDPHEVAQMKDKDEKGNLD